MKLSESNLQIKMQVVDVPEASPDTTNNATAGNVASVAKTDANLGPVPRKAKQRFPGKLQLKQRRNLGNDAESATDSSEHFTEAELHTSTDQLETTPGMGKQRHKVINRKRDLINLQSNLSPKYIGYANANSPITIHETDDTVRSTRRRNHTPAFNNSFELNSRDRETPPKPSLITSPPTLTNASYMSPIDKLLIKNGANSPNSTGFEADAEDVTISQPSRKHIKRKLKRGPRSKSKSKQESVQELEAIETTDKTASEQIIEKDEKEEDRTSPTIQENNQPDVEMKMEVDAEAEAELSEIVTTKDVENEVKSSSEKDSEGSQVEMMFALPSATSTEVESIKSPPDLMESTIKSEQSIKSPSSISIDSAKGSSILTESGWPSYQVGDLYWGKLFNYCYWPCMVCPDEFGQIVGNPPGQTRKSTDSSQGASVVIQVHVRFFADNGRHNWIKSENLLQFGGLKAFEELRDEMRIKHGAKHAKFRQMVAKQNQLLIWRQAIEEAQLVSYMPYDLRLEKFFEIHAKNVTLNKNKRKLSRHMQQDTSDVGSSLYDSTDNLHAKPLGSAQLEIAVKRERSSSPYSPAFSPVKHNRDMRVKRRKLSGSVEAHMGSSCASETQDERPMADVVTYENPEFGQLLDAIKEYVLVHRSNEVVEKVLLAVVRNIWSLRELQFREMERELTSGETELLGSARLETERGRSGGGGGGGTIKRLSNRLKTMVLRRSLTPVVPLNTSLQQQQRQTPDPVGPERNLSESTKVKKPVGRDIEEVIQDIMQLDRRYLFRGLNREPVCKYCYEPGGDVARCSLTCNSWLHAACLEQIKSAGKLSTKTTSGRKAIVKLENPSTSEIERVTTTPTPHVTGDVLDETKTDTKPLICHECAIGKPEPCCICHEENLPPESPLKEPATTTTTTTTSDGAKSQLMVCSQPMCTKKFHPSCCKYWPQASINNSTSRCPMHVCHTCVSVDPSGKYQQLGSAKLIKCVKCPATYHQDSRCIPAGSRMLTTTHLICPRHNISKADANLNVLWCYICVQGGELVCCETCPIAVHAHCRNIPIKTNENYICEECESGRLPLYGEIVWAKFNNFRWWPAIILPPTEIPSNIQKKPHGLSDFVVRFFGTNDHGWISRRRVYLYIEGDTGDGIKSKSLMSKRYTAGVEEATHYLKILKEKRNEQAMVRLNGNKLHPPPYIKIKSNKPVAPVRFTYNEEDVNVCECKSGIQHPCGAESGCLNRMLFNECNPSYCQAGNQCENQMFELRKYPRLDVVYMNERGFGLVSREPIAEGTFIIEYVGEVINHSEFQRRMAQKTSDRDENFYFLGVEKDFIIDAGPKGNLARFMNHSCEPNCATQKWTVNCINRVGLFAIKDIPENTELTFNYLWDDLMNNGKKACFCGAKRCSGEIGGKLKIEENKETGTHSGRNKTNSKLKHKGIKIQVGPAKKRLIKKSKSVSEADPESVDKE